AEADREAAPPRAMGDEVIRFVNRLIVGGLDREASDVHIEPTAGAPRIRLRVHGVLQEYPEAVPPAVTLKALTARIKVLAGLDITERRMPQDGRIGLTAGKRDVDLRVSTLPANRGEKIALRILEASGSTRQLEQIFFEQATLQAVRRALNRPYGGILVCGPTGSGKTSSLYSILNERKVTRPDTNIMMVEDPIEYRLPGVTQVGVNPAAGLGFPQVLRAMLRQDPDVIVVGETRDEETALLESLVARKIVDRSAPDVVLPRPVGCDACNQTGYVGRAVVLECLQITDNIREAIASGKPLAEVQQMALGARALTTFADYARY